MTAKKFTFAEEVVKNIQKGTVLKRSGDLFIVTEIVSEYYNASVDPIQSALFQTKPVYRSVGRVEPKFDLVSFSTGSRYYGKDLGLSDLLYKLSADKFKPVHSIEYKEVN